MYSGTPPGVGMWSWYHKLDRSPTQAARASACCRPSGSRVTHSLLKVGLSQKFNGASEMMNHGLRERPSCKPR